MPNHAEQAGASRPGRGGRAWVFGAAALIVCLGVGWYLTLSGRYIDDACVLLARNPEWRHYTQEVERRWGVPVAVQLAILRQESSFRADAYPPRTRLLGVIPWERATTAYGYAQALDATWAQYRAASGNPQARRDDFAAAVDFVGWYLDQTERGLGISKSDAYAQYLVYHEGRRGYREASHLDKPWLLEVAAKVHEYAARYRVQLRTCLADGPPAVAESRPD